MTALPGYLTTQELATRLGVTPKTVAGWVKRGLLRGDEVGGQLFIPEKSAEMFVPPRPGRPRKN